jgi:hypothetical protein
VTGALAIPVAWLTADETQFGGRLIVGWNTFGMRVDRRCRAWAHLEEWVPPQFIHAGVGTAAMQTLPWRFVPTVLVPVFLIAHAISFMRIHAGPGRARPSAGLDRRT